MPGEGEKNRGCFRLLEAHSLISIRERCLSLGNFAKIAAVSAEAVVQLPASNIKRGCRRSPASAWACQSSCNYTGFLANHCLILNAAGDNVRYQTAKSQQQPNIHENRKNLGSRWQNCEAIAGQVQAKQIRVTRRVAITGVVPMNLSSSMMLKPKK